MSHACTAHAQELFGGYDGVNLLVSYLKRDIGKFGSGLGHNRLLLAAVDCVWCAVVGSPITEDIFLETGGAFVLLDLLKVRTVPLTSHHLTPSHTIGVPQQHARTGIGSSGGLV